MPADLCQRFDDGVSNGDHNYDPWSVKSGQVRDSFDNLQRAQICKWFNAHYADRGRFIITPAHWPRSHWIPASSCVDDEDPSAILKFERFGDWDLPFAVHAYQDISAANRETT